MWQQFVHLDGVTMPHMYLKAYEKLIGIERPPKTNDRHIWKELVSLGFKGCPKWACIDFMWQAYEVFFFFQPCPNGNSFAPNFDKPHQEGS